MNAVLIAFALIHCILAVPQFPFSASAPSIPLTFTAKVILGKGEPEEQRLTIMQDGEKKMKKIVLVMKETGRVHNLAIFRDGVYRNYFELTEGIKCFKGNGEFRPELVLPSDLVYKNTEFFDNALVDTYESQALSIFFDATNGLIKGNKAAVGGQQFVGLVEEFLLTVDESEFGIPEHVTCDEVPSEQLQTKFLPF